MGKFRYWLISMLVGKHQYMANFTIRSTLVITDGAFTQHNVNFDLSDSHRIPNNCRFYILPAPVDHEITN